MTIAEFVYTVLLKPRPLRRVTNACIRSMLPRSVRYGSARIILNPNDPVISGALAFRVYEKGEIAFVRKMLKPGMTMLDIGANVGLYSAIGSHAVGKDGRVLAFEPDPETFRYLEATIRANEGANIQAFQFAASRQQGVARLYTSSTNRGDNRLYDNELRDGSVEVRTVRLDDFLPAVNVSGLDFIKIDVQGFEGHALEGLGEIIRNSPGVVLMTEFWPYGLSQAGTDPLQFLEMLEGFGLQLHRLDTSGRTMPLGGKNAFIAQHRGRHYTNVIGFGPSQPDRASLAALPV
jgi:FkbM family methyltransferase